MTTPVPPETIATLVSSVTQVMLGFSFTVGPAADLTDDLCWRASQLSIAGKRPVTLALSSNQAGCSALGAAMFSCSLTALDTSMIMDSLGELVNMTAGQLKRVLAIDDALGLPSAITAADLVGNQGAWNVVRLRSGDVELVVWQLMRQLH